MDEHVYCAVNSTGEIQWVKGSSSKTRYFKTNKYLQGAVQYHNKIRTNDQWRIAKFKLVEVTEDDQSRDDEGA